MPRDTNELESPDSQEEVAFKESFRRDFPNFRADPKDIRALNAVRRLLKIQKYHDLNVFVLLDKKHPDVSAEKAFARDDENNVVFFSTRASIKNALEARGHKAEKANLERHAKSERADIFIALDEKLAVTKFLRANILPGGYILCRLKTANALRAHGYTFRAHIDMSDETPSISRENDPEFWKSVQVNTDKELREASSDALDGVVTYEEARQKVREAKEAGVPEMSEDDVCGSYKKLIEMAEEQNPSATEGKAPLSITIPSEEKEVTISGINTVLPTKKSEHDRDIIVMRRMEGV